MKLIENVQGSKESAKNIVIDGDVVRIHTNVTDISYKEKIDDDVEISCELYQYDELQMTKDECLVYLFEEIQKLKGEVTNED